MKRGEMLRFLILRTIGNFLVIFAVFGIIATFGPALYFEINFRIAEARGVKYVVAPKPESQNQKPVNNGIANFAQVLAGPKVQELIPSDTDFSILIPKIGANAKIFPNVDPADQNKFLPVLTKGVAHAAGTVFPGIKGNIYLFAHSTDNFWDVGRYNAVFYLLKDLKKGDEVVIFYKNTRYNYLVSDTKVVNPEEVSYLVDSQKQDKQTLILQTCWPPGTTFQRLLVLAVPK